MSVIPGTASRGDLDPATFNTLIATMIDVEGAENKFGDVIVSGCSCACSSALAGSRREPSLTWSRHVAADAIESDLAGSPPGLRLQTEVCHRQSVHASWLMEGTGIGANVDELTAVIARALDLFSPAHREQAIRAWLGATDGEILLTRAASRCAAP